MQVRNCRLGMLAALGFAVQAWVTGKGPIQNAIDHLRDPFGQNGESTHSVGLHLGCCHLNCMADWLACHECRFYLDPKYIA